MVHEVWPIYNSGYDKWPPAATPRETLGGVFSTPARWGRLDAIMPEPNYNDGDPPGIFSLIVGAVAVFILLLVIKSCLGSG